VTERRGRAQGGIDEASKKIRKGWHWKWRFSLGFFSVDWERKDSRGKEGGRVPGIEGVKRAIRVEPWGTRGERPLGKSETSAWRESYWAL